MKADLKREWVAALRGGEYKQGKGRLCHEGKYCCMGVLAECMGAVWTSDGQPVVGEEYIGGSTMLYLWDILSTDAAGMLATMNDAGVCFDAIADFIEENL